MDKAAHGRASTPGSCKHLELLQFTVQRMLCDIMLHAMIIIDPEASSSTKARADAALALPVAAPVSAASTKGCACAGQVSVLLASDSAIKRLNGKFRGKHRPNRCHFFSRA